MCPKPRMRSSHHSRRAMMGWWAPFCFNLLNNTSQSLWRAHFGQHQSSRSFTVFFKGKYWIFKNYIDLISKWEISKYIKYLTNMCWSCQASSLCCSAYSFVCPNSFISRLCRR
jgi:hypothetical protein